MKKIFLILLFLASIIFIKASSEVTELQQALAAIKTNADGVSYMFNTPTYYRQKIEEIHTQCTNAHPGCCKSDHLTGFGVFTLVGGSAAFGALATFAILRTLEKTHS